MATLTVKQSGGDYSTLASAIAAASNNDIISIEGTWSVDDTAYVQIDTLTGLTIQTDADSRHPGYVMSSPTHYRLVVNGNDCIEINVAAADLTIDGLVIQSAGAATNQEGIEFKDGSGNLTVKNCILWCTNTNDTSGLIVANDSTVTVENCIFYDWTDSGIEVDSDTGDIIVVNIDSCTFYNNATNNVTNSGGILMRQRDTGTLTCHIDNTISVENDSQSGVDYKEWQGSITWDINYSIDSDNSITGVIGSVGTNLASRTAVDSDSGAGSYVVFEDITSSPYDFRLQDLGSAKNNAQDGGATTLDEDILGTVRPSGGQDDIGAFEVLSDASLAAEGASFTVTASDVTLVGPDTIFAESASFTVTGGEVTLSTPFGWWSPTWWGSEWWQEPWWGQIDASRELPADSATYTVSGSDVDLNKGFTLSAASATFTVTGATVGLNHGRHVDADPAAFTVTGSDVTFNYYNLPVDSATLTVTVNEDVELDRTSLISYSLPVDNAVFTVTGSDVELDRGYTLAAATAAFTVTGTVVDLEVDNELLALRATVTVSASDVSLYAPSLSKIDADPASFSVSASDITFSKGAIAVTFGQYDKTNIIKPEPHGVRISPEGEGFFFR